MSFEVVLGEKCETWPAPLKDGKSDSCAVKIWVTLYYVRPSFPCLSQSPLWVRLVCGPELKQFPWQIRDYSLAALDEVRHLS